MKAPNAVEAVVNVLSSNAFLIPAGIVTILLIAQANRHHGSRWCCGGPVMERGHYR